MKKLVSALLIPLLLLALAACGKPAAAIPNPPLVLGEKYLLDLDYEQALLQFDQAIRIEPKNPRGYLGKADALLHLDRQPEAASALADGAKATRGDAREALKSARAGVEKNPVDGYIALSSAYEKLGWREIALALLQRVYAYDDLPEKSRLRDALEKMMEGVAQTEKPQDMVEITETEAPKKPVKRMTIRQPDGSISTTIYENDDKGNMIGYVSNRSDGSTYSVTLTLQYNEKGQITRHDGRNADGETWYATLEYNNEGQKIREEYHQSDGYSHCLVSEYDTRGELAKEVQTETSSTHSLTATVTYSHEYNNAGQVIRTDRHHILSDLNNVQADQTDFHFSETMEYNDEGLLVRKNSYDEGKLSSYSIYEY